MTADATAKAIAADLAALPHRGAAPMREVRRAWSRRLKAEPAGEVIAIARALKPLGRRWIGYELIRAHRPAFEAFAEADIEAFAEGLDSWDSVDAYGVILAGPAWAAGRLSDAAVVAWTRSPDRWRRRLALVVTVPLNPRGSPGAAERTLAVCERLIADRDDMVVKAMSWALRALAIRDRPAVEAFLDAHEEDLAARVKREVRNKLSTGLKTPNRLRVDR